MFLPCICKMKLSITNPDHCSYLLAVLPGEPVGPALSRIKGSIVQYLRPEICQPPHIKVYPVFKWNDKEEYLLVQHIKNNLPQLYSFEVEIRNFACNKTKQQLFMPTQTSNSFEACYQQFRNYFSGHLMSAAPDAEEINGQLILANGDLKENALPKAWNVLKNKNFEATFYADKISLLKLDNTGWQLFKQFHLD